MLAVFQIAMDPLFHWHPPYKKLIREWPAGAVLTIPSGGPDDYQLTMEMARALPPPDLVITGNSKILLVDSKMFAPSARIFNVRISRSFIDDYRDVWELYRKRGATPRRLILTVDPYMFNRNTGPLSPISNFLSARGIPFLGAGTRRALRNVLDLFRWEMLQAAIDRRKDRRAHPDRQDFYFAVERNLGDDQCAVRPDGSYILPVANIKPVTLEELRRLGADLVVKKDPSNNLSHFALDQNLLSALGQLVDKASADGARVMLIAPPSYTSVVRDWLSAQKEGNILGQFDTALAALSDGGKRFDYCRMFDPDVAGCAETEFVSPEHTRRSCTEKYVVKCLRAFPQWRDYAPRSR